jgi:SHS2 domain-containing protein
MTYRFVEHTADLMIEVTSMSFEELLRESLLAMMLWTGPEWGDATVTRDFAIEASDRTMLLVDLLNEALTLSQIHHEAYDRLEFRPTGSVLSIEGSFIGRSITGARDEIKAVTCHEASVAQLADDSWKARFLVDI